MFQIHIGGAKRSGKTTLAKNVAWAVTSYSSNPVVLDVDEVRREIFGQMAGVPDSPESLRDHFTTINAIFNSMVPRVIEAGGIPIVVAGHSRRDQFDRAVEISERLGTKLYFFLVEAPTLEEAAKRAREASPDDKTDISDFSDPVMQQSFLDAVKRIEATYASINDPRLFRIPQGTPDEMLGSAIDVLGQRLR